MDILLDLTCRAQLRWGLQHQKIRCWNFSTSFSLDHCWASAWNCMHILSIHFSGSQNPNICSCQNTTSRHGQWPTALRYFKWALGVEQIHSEKGENEEETGSSDRIGGWRQCLIHSGYGVHSCMKINHDSSLSYQRKEIIGYFISPIAKRNQREKVFTEKHRESPKWLLNLNANIIVCLGVCEIFRSD